MPAYNAQVPPVALFPYPPSHTLLVFNADTLIAGEFSQQVILPPGPTAGQKGIRVVIDFSADPGAGEIDVMESDAMSQNDVLGHFLILF